jgi:pimeloyl-ACP methyl ester carboxylesterase
MNRRFSARDGLQLAALDWEGPEGRTPILCLPGITRAAADFAGLAARHGATRRVLAFDHAGHGDSARPAALGRYRIEESLRDVLDGMAALHAPRCVIVGTSYGGILAMALAVLRPTALAGLVLNDVGPVLSPGGMAQVRDFLGTDPALPDLDACTAYMRRVQPPLAIDDAGWRRVTANSFAPGPDGRFHPRWDIRIGQVMDAAGPPPDLRPAFGALAHVPLLLVHGLLSELLLPETVAWMRAARPDMGVAEIDGSGHAPTLEEPVAIAAIDAFLDAIP